MILARGGGATDDLSAFNDERVVRAVFGSSSPVVVGVGHATDRTLVEDVADLVAPTPSAAAEMCVPSIHELNEHVQSLGARLNWSFDARVADATAAAHAASRRLIAANPKWNWRESGKAVQVSTNRLHRSALTRVTSGKQHLAASADVLAALEPAAVLRRGYAAVQLLEDRRPVFSVSQVKPGTALCAAQRWICELIVDDPDTSRHVQAVSTG